jgi:hypothetical protein
MEVGSKREEGRKEGSKRARKIAKDPEDPSLCRVIS